MKIFKAMASILVLALLFAGCFNPAGAGKSDAKSLVSFKFEAAKNSGVLTADYPAVYNDLTGKWEVGPLPATTNVSALIPTFAVSPLATVKVGTALHSSGVTPNSFANDVIYTVVAEDGTAATYTIAVKVTVASTSKDIIAYKLNVGGTMMDAKISGTAISLTVQSGTAVSALVATFTLSDAKAVATIGATTPVTQVSATTPNSFTNPVSYIVTAEDGSKQTYTVTVTVQIPSKVIITEYYEGASGNNKYLEITNTDTASADLSTYALRAYTNGSLTPVAADYPLTGTLPAGMSVVYVNDGYTPATLNTVAAISPTVGNATGWMVPVAYVSGIAGVSFTGNDVIQLINNGDLLDSVGVVGNSTESSATGKDVKMIRKTGKTGVWTWSPGDWYIVPVLTATATSEDDTAGTYAATAAGSTLTEFWVMGSSPIKGTITGTNIAVTNVSSTTAVLPAYFMTTAGSVVVGSVEQVCGQTTQDFTAPVSYVVSTGGVATTYVVTVSILPPVNYSATNYTFDGGVLAARAAVLASTTLDFTISTSASGQIGIKNLDGSGSWVATTNEGVDTPVTGIVTQITSNNLYLQDQNSAICFYKSGAFAAPSFKIGDKVTVTNARAGYAYYGLIEVTKFGAGGSVAPAITVVQTGNDIYYIDATTGWETDGSLRVIRYSGTITTAATSSSPYRGSFDNDTTKRYKTTSSGLVTSLGIGTTTSSPKTYYGITDVYRLSPETSGFAYLLLTSSDQIR